MHLLLFPSKVWFLITITTSMILILAAAPISENAAAPSDGNLSTCSVCFSCGELQNIGYPFWGLDRPESCGHPAFRLNCTEGIIPVITINSVTYRVLNINSFSRILEVARPDYYNNICPTHLINSTFISTLFELNRNSQMINLCYGCEQLFQLTTSDISGKFDCPVNGTSSTVGYYGTGNFTKLYFLSCNFCVNIPILSSKIPLLKDSSLETLTDSLKDGFEVQWSANDFQCDFCLGSGGQCGHDITAGVFICYCSDGAFPDYCSKSPRPPGTMFSHSKDKPKFFTQRGKLITGLSVVAAAIVVVCIVWVIVTRYKTYPRQRKTNANASVEAFVKKYGTLAPKQYSYTEIKKMTNKFKEKLGQGGFGSVYKGKLPDGHLVAVKLLSQSKGNGEDFMNEVGSISRTSHVNVVTLLGFCYNGLKRALVFEFMPHGSLDKFIYNGGPVNQNRLEWKLLYDIALGIARGLEYLHQGCNTRILHFDIKHHNILLDESFCPKISDFGLSKLCERKESVVSMTGARGTIGFIAPEVFCRNLGGVSYKSDVYSYGMMVLEMVGGRKNIDVGVSQTSEIYFPSWIYNHLDQAMDLKLDGVTTAEEEEITRKLIVVSFWCIQTMPSDRPSMTKVLEMLQGSLEALPIPPRPFVSSSPVRSPITSSTASTMASSLISLQEENVM